jgi:hypothetical protein
MDDLEHQSDWELIQLCKHGDGDAWKELLGRHQGSVRLSIRQKLGDRAKDVGLVEDRIQDVFTALIDPKYRRLEHYDPDRGGFDTFLKALASQVIQEWRRHEATQIEGKFPLDDGEPCEAGNAGLVQAEFAEYVADLTPQEARCLREKLMRTQGPSSEIPIKPGNERWLRHRLKEKWKDHFDGRV